MATPTASREQQAAQTGLIVLMLHELAGTWRLLDPARLAGTMPRWVAAVNDVVDRYGQAAGAMALDYYDAERTAAGVSGRAPTTLLREPDPDQVENSLRWATKNLWDQELLDNAAALERELEQIAREEEAAIADLATLDEDDLAEIGADEVADDMAEPHPEPPPGDAAGQAHASRSKVDGIAARLVTNVGRGAVIDAATEDRAAVAVARRAAPNACAFCRTMAIRKAVYKNLQTAGRRANAKFVGDGAFKFHDRCRCWATPIFAGEEWEPQPEVERWEAEYKKAKAMPGNTIRNYERLLRMS